MDVYYTAGTAAQIGVSDTDFQTAVTRAIAIWNDQGSMAVRLRWVGTTPEPGAINIYGYAHSGSGECDNGLALTTQSVDGSNHYNWAQIAIWGYYFPTTSCIPIPWETGKENFEAEAVGQTDLVTVMVHELGHAVGLAHSNTCGSPEPVSVMHPLMSDILRRESIKRYDIDDSRTPEGPRSAYSTLNRETFVDSTQTWPAPTTQAGWNIGYRPESLSQNYAVTTEIGWLDFPNAYGSLGRVWESRFQNNTWLNSQALTTSAMLEPIGIGVAPSGFTPSTNEVLVAYRLTSDSPLYSGVSNYICYRKSTDGGQTYGAETCPANYTGSERKGVSVTYDPYTKTFLIAYALSNYPNNGQLRVITVPGSGSTTPAYVTDLTGVYSWHAPSIACTGASGSSCRMAWEDRTLNGCLTWHEAYVNATTGQFTPTALRSQCYLLFDSPSIAYYQYEGKYRLAFSQGGAIYSFVMGQTDTAWTGAADIWNNSNSSIATATLATEYGCTLTRGGWVCVGDLRAWFLRWY